MEESLRKFTVLGATGFIGKNLVAHLKQLGAEVFTPVRGDASIFEKELGHVIYCVGMTADFRKQPFATSRAHVGFIGDVLERCDFQSLLYLSSTRVYAGAVQTNESAALRIRPDSPSDLYNITKIAGESLTLHCGRKNTRVARLSNVAGHDPQSDNFLSSVIKEALLGKIVLRSSLASAKDYVLLEDVVAMLTKISQFGQQKIYNLASGHNINHKELTRILSNITGCSIEVIADAPLHYFEPIDTQLLKKEFNFESSLITQNLHLVVSGYQ